MAPSRGQGRKATNSRRHLSSQRLTRASAALDNLNAAGDVYQSMLAEAETEEDHTDRPLKKRKVASSRNSGDHSKATETPEPVQPPPANKHRQFASKSTSRGLQTVDDSSDSAESDLDFEDVDLEIPKESLSEDDNSVEDVSISMENTSSAKTTPLVKRKPMTGPEKAHRLLVHKLHILCLLGHCMYVNGRCNNPTVQRRLAPILTKKVLSYLQVPSDHSQFERSRSFADGLQQCVEIFTGRFLVDASGLHKPHWNRDASSQADSEVAAPVNRTDFIEAAKELAGSQDSGSQLFCALLRSAGIDARIVCSLQPLPFGNVPKAPTPRKPQKEVVFAIASDKPPTTRDVTNVDATVQSSAGIGMVPSARRRLGQPSFSNTTVTHRPVSQPARNPIRKLAYPVYWVEAFNAAQQKWVAVDPMITHTVNKPSKLEPPSSYDLNHMLYVIAFEDNGTARDVTKRYAKAYNAKTRQHRVEAIGADGERWWKQVMRFFRRRNHVPDRDQVEDAELAQKEAREGLPANVQNFRNHPYYALERHLRRHEVIHPRREVGKVNAGTAAKPRMEAIFRRRDVLVCRSGDKWYRLGRVIKPGEQPVKRVPSRNKRNLSPEDADLDDEDATSTGLYSSAQTDLYVPPAIHRGRVTKNAYGNLDVYVPSMVPAGGTHIRHAFAQRAARLLKIDYADAVTGFSFKGRKGTAIVDGIVVASQFGDAVRAAIDGFAEEIVEEDSRARSLNALKLWKRFLTGLRIAERVKAYGEASAEEDASSVQSPGGGRDKEDVDMAGGFILNQGEQTLLPTAGRFSLRELTTPSSKAQQKKRKTVEDSDDESLVSGNETDDEHRFAVQPNRHEANDGGGFVVDDTQEEPDLAGGFIADNASIAPDSSEGGGFLPGKSSDKPNFGESGGFLVGDDGADEETDRLFDDGAEELEELPSGIRQAIQPLKAQDHGSIAVEQDPKMAIETSVIESDVEAVQARETETLNPVLETESVVKAYVAKDDEDAAENGRHDDASDMGSLLSHDPDDDDAEPDWLESD